MWPVIDLVALIAISRAAPDDRPPKTVQIASASRLSPSGVDVPCGLMRSTSSAGTPRRSSAIFIARAEPIAGVDRLDHVPAVGRGAVADDLGVDPRAARLGQLEVLEQERARALTEDEPVAGQVERARDGLRGLARPRHAHPAHVREAGVSDLEQRRLGRAAR